MRLIDADKLNLRDVPICLTDGVEMAERMIAIIKNAPTVDAAPVVRCRECNWGTGNLICSNPKCGKSYYGVPVSPEHFCSFGERKSNG